MNTPDLSPQARLRHGLLRWCGYGLAACLAAITLPALADPPAQVGRMSWIAGDVRVRTASDGAENPAQLNWPLTNGDQLSTGPSGRAEVWIGSTTLRLDTASRVTLTQVDQGLLRVQLEQGTVGLRVATPEQAQATSIEMPAGRFTPDGPGEYRVDTREGRLAATAWSGSLSFSNGTNTWTIAARQRADFGFDANGVHESTRNAVGDDFDAFARGRDADFNGRTATRYVSPEMTGVEDLDSYGHWVQAPDYGTVWVPSVEATWAPYRSGHWAWIAPWGYTWVDSAPWGFAPFHYGRWATWDGRWCWVPGSYVARPVYAPALVGWVGGPPVGVSVTIGAGVAVGASVGWFPLGPREVYVPAYAASPTYVRNVNVTHVTNITNITEINNVNRPGGPAVHYRFQNDPRAMTIVPSTVVHQQQPVARSLIAPNDPRAHELVSNGTVAGAPPVPAPVHAGQAVTARTPGQTSMPAPHEVAHEPMPERGHPGERTAGPAEPGGRFPAPNLPAHGAVAEERPVHAAVPQPLPRMQTPHGPVTYEPHTGPANDARREPVARGEPRGVEPRGRDSVRDLGREPARERGHERRD